MTKEEIKNIILTFKSDQEILMFIKNRIIELEQNLSPEKLGLPYKHIHNDYISNKTEYIVGHSIFGTDSPSLVFDDITPYFELIKELSASKEYSNELYLFTPLMNAVFNYLSSKESRNNIEETIIKRNKLFAGAMRNGETQISVRKIHDGKIGLCSENAGLAHNIFKILAIDSQLVIGKRNEEEHAFNIVFPRGYGNSPAVLFDPSYSIDFTDKLGNKYSSGYFKVLTQEEYNNILSGYATSINLEGSVNTLLKYYPMLSGCTANFENANYSVLIGDPLKIEKGDNTRFLE